MSEDYCLWMGDIDPRMNESIIRNFFKFYDVNPQDIKLIKNKTNKNKNHCFIYFKNIYEANNTLNQLNGKSIPNTPFKFKLSWANYFTSESKILFVGNLNPLIDDIILFNFFKSKYKSVLKAKIIKDNGKSKRYGFVTFKKVNDYRKCLIEMNGVFFEGSNIRVKEYIKKEEDVNNNNHQFLKENNTDNILEVNNIKNKNINDNKKIINMNNLNSKSLLSVSNSVSKINWINNINPINDVITSVNFNSNKNINSKNSLFNQSTFNCNYYKKNNCINFNNSINFNKKYNRNINNNLKNISNINNDTKNNTTINDNKKINKRKINKKQKLEILEELDEKILKIKINVGLNKILKYYKENILINGNRAVSKLIFYLIFV